MLSDAFCLLHESWLPVRRARSGTALIRPAEITATISGDDPVVALDWPRPDLRVACLEFLIGLLATACPPEETDDWPEFWHKPPTPERLDEAFAPLAPAFILDGDGPRFLQDLEDLDTKPWAIERLLIDSPGGDDPDEPALLVKRGRLLGLGRSAAAMALYTLQAGLGQ